MTVLKEKKKVNILEVARVVVDALSAHGLEPAHLIRERGFATISGFWRDRRLSRVNFRECGSRAHLSADGSDNRQHHK